jgi:shikimate kinase
MIPDIILIGPPRAGKTTLGKLLAARLRLPQCSLDRRRGYYKDAGFDESLADRIVSERGFEGLYHYRKPFDLEVVARVLSECRNCVFDFGACHSTYEDVVLRARARKLLRAYTNVVLLLPDPDAGRSMRVLKERGCLMSIDGFNLCEHLVTHPSNFELAKLIVYTDGKTPAETCEEILLLTGHAKDSFARRTVEDRQPAVVA